VPQDKPKEDKMRIAGGILLLLVGLASTIEGGCVAMGCVAASNVGSALGEARSALQNKNASEADLKKVGEGQLKDLEKMAGRAGSIGVASIVIRVGGLLCLIAGILLLVNKAKVFGIIAPCVGIVGEILLFVMLAFNVFGLVKILIYAFGAFAATKVGARGA
jgi:hypothetical protein